MAPDTDSAGSADAVFAANLKALREHRGLTQEAMAAQLSERGKKWHQSTIYKIENGERKVSVGEAILLAEALSVSVDQMADGKTGAHIGELAEVQRAWAELLDITARLERNAAAYEAARHKVQDLLGDGTPWEVVSKDTLAMIDPAELATMLEASKRPSEVVAKQVGPF